MSIKRGVFFTLIICVLFSFQNCSSGIQFEEVTDLNSLTCQPITPQVMSPTLLWDWQSQLPKTADHYPDFNQVMSAPMVADLDGDSVPEIVFTSFPPNTSPQDSLLSYYSPEIATTIANHLRNGVLRIIDGATGKTKKSVGALNLAPQGSRTPLLVDLDKDGKIEIVYLHYGNNSVVALNYDGTARWKYNMPTQLGIDVKGLNAFDLDQDGLPEMAVGPYVISERNKIPFLKLQLANRSTTAAGSQVGLSLDGSDVQIVDSESGVYNRQGVLKFAFDTAANNMGIGNLIPTSPGLEVAVANLGIVKIYSATGSRLRTLDLNLDQSLKCGLTPHVGGGAISVANFDGNSDGKMQMAIATGRYLSIIDSDGRVMAKAETRDCSSMRTGLTTFDFNGDGQPEILYADEEYFRVYYLKGGQLQEAFRIPNPSATVVEYPVVADINGDGTSEILVTANNYNVTSNDYYYVGNPNDYAIGKNVTGVRAYKSINRSWMPTRPIWNQFDYIPGNVNNRGQISADFRNVGFDIIRRNTYFIGNEEAACQ